MMLLLHARMLLETRMRLLLLGRLRLTMRCF